MKKLKQILEEETGFGNDEFFMADPDELEDEEDEVDEFDEDSEDEMLEEILGLNEDFSLEDFMDCWDP